MAEFSGEVLNLTLTLPAGQSGDIGTVNDNRITSSHRPVSIDFPNGYALTDVFNTSEPMTWYIGTGQFIIHANGKLTSQTTVVVNLMRIDQFV